MNSRKVISIFAFGVVLFSVLTIVAFNFSETSMGNTSISAEKTFDPRSMDLSVKPGDDFSALTIVAFNYSETLMGNTSISAEKTFDPRSMDLSVKPGDDFYEYAEGNWIKNHPVPADKPLYGETEILGDRVNDRVKEIVESAANNTSAPDGSIEQKIGEFYRMGMDNTTLEKQRLDPIRDELKMIDNISSTSDIQAVSTQMMEYGMDPFFSIYADADKKNSKVMIANLLQGGLSLPNKFTQDRDFYLRQDNESLKTREQYLAHVTKMFVFLGDSPKIAENNAKTVLRIETRLAKASFSSVENTDSIKTYNKMSLEKLQNLAPGINWSRLFSSLGHPEVAEVNVRNPSYFKELSNTLQDESIADWKTFLRWKLILATSPYLSSDLEKEHFDFYAKKVNGQQEMQPRWIRVINVENRGLGEAIGHLYVNKYFDASSKDKMQEMASNLKKALRERIQNLTWMEPETKKKALMKLETLDIQVGYPDEWLNYSGLEVKNDSYVMNVFRASNFQFHHGPHGIDRIGKPVDRKMWEMNPQEINAYADYNKVVVVFPAGILQPPFFDKAADDAINYGAIGAIIGHEMTHHFDSQGRKYDANGNLTNWWTQKDADNFNNSNRILVDEYNKCEILPDLYINGNLTLQENIADFGGLTMAYHAYKLSSKGEPKIIDGFTGDQRFFLSFARIWREADTEECLRTLTLTNKHSPVKFRVNCVIFNIPEFYKAFPSINPGEKLYRSESKRPIIW